MHWEIIEDGVEVSIITKIDVLWLFMAIIGFLYLVFISVRDSRKMKRQLKLWLESGEQPSQTTFISTEEWTAMLPIQWINLPGWEHFFDLWIRPQLELYRKAKAWAILSILIGSASTIFDLIKALQRVAIYGTPHIIGVSVKISEALVPSFFAVVIGLFFYLLAACADSRITNWRKRMLDTIKIQLKSKSQQ